MDLLTAQEKLQNEAYQVIEELELLETLTEYGSVEIIGSVELGLMTWKDIDIDVISQDLKTKSVADFIQQLILKVDKRVDLTFINNSDQTRPQLPQGLYVGLKYYKKGLAPEDLKSSSDEVWKIDIWFFRPEFITTSNKISGREKTKQIKAQLNQENKKTILEIKQVIAKDPRHRKEIYSVDIYDAVLNNNVKNLAEFETYIKAKKLKSLL